MTGTTANDDRAGLLAQAAPGLFKVGFLVQDLARATDDFGRWLGLQWTEITTSPLELEAHGKRESVALRYVYSTTGPVYLELIEARETGYYAVETGPCLHHVGRWSANLTQDSARLEREGLPCEAFGLAADGTHPALFAFHAGDHGMRIELVADMMRPGFEAWLAGGELELP
jgi:hypothetical protein